MLPCDLSETLDDRIHQIARSQQPQKTICPFAAASPMPCTMYLKTILFSPIHRGLHFLARFTPNEFEIRFEKRSSKKTRALTPKCDGIQLLFAAPPVHRCGRAQAAAVLARQEAARRRREAADREVRIEAIPRVLGPAGTSGVLPNMTKCGFS